MKVLFVMDRRSNAGSIQAVNNYVRAGDELGHVFALYGREDPAFPSIRFSTEVEAFDFVLFVVESSLAWMSGLRMPRILASVPLDRRAVLDADGMYNRVIEVEEYDRNYASEQERSTWLRHLDHISERIIQPTLEPLEGHLLALPFYGYNPSSITPQTGPKPYDLLHIGHNWWRWRQLKSDVLPALERIRHKLDRISFVGSWWDGAPPATPTEHLRAFEVDRDRLMALRIEIRPAVHYSRVTSVMSEGRVNLMTQRPLFRELRLFTSKYFEIFTADTIPLVMLDPEHAESVYGPAGRELAVRGRVAETLLDVLAHPDDYRALSMEVREHLHKHHSYCKRVTELVASLGA